MFEISNKKIRKAKVRQKNSKKSRQKIQKSKKHTHVPEEVMLSS